MVTGAVIAAASCQMEQPKITVDVSAGAVGSTRTVAIADTGAMVCVAGPSLMQALGLKRAMLTKCKPLRDVAGRIIEVHGSYHCRISVNNEHTYQAIYFVQTARACFISLTACKELNLVHKSFPNQLPTVGVTYPSGSSHPAARHVSAEEHPTARRMSAK